MKTLRQQLLVAFIGIALIVVGLFGFMAHYISTEFAAKSEIHVLQDLAEERAAPLSDKLSGKTLQQASQVLTQHNKYSNLPIILIDSSNRIVAGNPLVQTLNYEHIKQYFSTLSPNRHGGIVSIDGSEYMWSIAAIPDTQYRLIMFHAEGKDLSFFEALGIGECP